MNNKSKTMLAILAVALMVGTALVPLVGVSGEEVEDETSTTKMDQVGFEELMNAVRNLGQNGQSLILNGFSLVPVDDSNLSFTPKYIDETKTTDPIKITGQFTVNKTEKLVLCDADKTCANPKYVFGDGTAENNGSIYVAEGNCIELWPASGNYNFTLENKNNQTKSGYTNVVKLKSGAYISMFGVTFKLLCGGSAENTFMVNLFTLHKNITASFITNDLGNWYMEFGLKVESETGRTNSSIKILECIDAFAGTDISIKGKYLMSANEDGSKTCSFVECTVDFTLNDCQYEYVMKSKSNPGTYDYSFLSFNLTPSTQLDEDGNAQYNCGIEGISCLCLDSFAYNLIENKIKTTLFSMNDVFLTFDGINIQSKNTVDDSGSTGYKRIVTSQTTVGWKTSGSEGIKLSASTFAIGPSTAFIEPTVNITDFKFTVNGPELGIETMMGGTKGKTAVTAITDFDMSIDVDMGKVALNIVGVTLASTDAVSMSISSLSVGFDGNTVKVSVGTFGTKAEFTSDQPLVASTLSFTMEVVNPTLLYDVVNDIETFSFDFSAGLSTTFDGADRHAKFNIDNFVMIVADGTTIAKVDSVTLTNDIPFSKIIPVTEDVICEFEAKELIISTNDAGNTTIHGDSLSFDNNTLLYGIVDRYGVSVNDFDIEIVPPATEKENTKFVMTSATINGFTKNLGEDKVPFSVTGNPAKISVAYVNSLTDYRITIEEGTATFGKGILPFPLAVSDGVTFIANGFSAVNIYFGANVSMSGTIVVDLADKIKYYRTIVIGKERLRPMPVVGEYNDMGGYILTLNLSTKTGTIVAHDGWTINSDPSKYTKKSETYATFEFKKMDLKNVTSSDFYFSVQGGEPEKVGFGQKIDLSKYDVPKKTGKEFVGWSDGSQIYNSDATYIMPARTVVMEPLFAEIVTPTQVEGESGTVIVAATDPDSTAVAVKASDIEGKKKVIIEVENASVVMDQETVKAVVEQAGTNDKVILSVQKVEEIYDSTEKKVVGDNDLYNINLTVGGKSVEFSDKTTFKVTLNVEAEGQVIGFNVSYMDDTYHTTSVNVDDFDDLGNGLYDVTFTVNHFSDYIVEPIVEDVPTPEPTTSTDMFIVTILSVFVALVILLIFAMMFVGDRKKA